MSNLGSVEKFYLPDAQENAVSLEVIDPSSIISGPKVFYSYHITISNKYFILVTYLCVCPSH